MSEKFLGKSAGLYVRAQLVRTETKNVVIQVDTTVNGTGIWTASTPDAEIIGDGGKRVTRLCVFALDHEHEAQLFIHGPQGTKEYFL